MSGFYLGKLLRQDPLYDILFSQVCPELRRDPIFHVDRMSSFKVFKYTEERTGTTVIGKFFEPDEPSQDKVLRIKGEYDNLQKIRTYGFDRFPNYVVRPIGREQRIGLALLEEFVHGRDLDYFLKEAIYNGKESSLKQKLSRLAAFLHVLHERTNGGKEVELDPVSAYFQRIIRKLRRQGIVSDPEEKIYLKLMDRWLNLPALQKVRSVIVHGDATPTNFIFTGEYNAIAIDLERMKNADALFDIGMICGEIKHAFFWRAGNPYQAEPFIRHFFDSYSCLFTDAKKAFRNITRRNPFYMAMTELRIARNEYLDLSYRKRLAYEAFKCLKWGLKLQ